jgi:hypothetical protein
MHLAFDLPPNNTKPSLSIAFDDKAEVQKVVNFIFRNPVDDYMWHEEPVKEVVKDDKDVLVNVAFEKRIENALAFLSIWGQVEGDHHKAWVIDQVVRALCGCEWNFNDSFFQNEEYKDWISGYCYDDNHVMEYEWDTGIAP